MAPTVHAAGRDDGARHVSTFFGIALTVLVFWPSLRVAAELALSDDRYLQVILAPLACCFLVFRERTAIFSRTRYSPGIGIPLVLLAMVPGLLFAFRSGGGDRSILPFAIFACAIALMGIFVLCYGVRSFQAALYPLCCLFLMIPIPAVWMDGIATALQHGSAALSHEILKLSGVPVFRHGMQFTIPGLDFQVAPECSGIRSSVASMMIAITAGYIYLSSGWSRLALMLVTIPIVLFKNAVRIVVISTLAAYVDRVFLDGPFHHKYGGMLFSIVGMTLFVLALVGLQKIEGWRRGRSSGQIHTGGGLIPSFLQRSPQ